MLKPEIPQKPSQEELIDQLLSGGESLDSIIVAARARSEAKNRAAQSDIPPPIKQSEADWKGRKAWLLDGHPIYGELKEFFFPALTALKTDDQLTFSRQRDLLFKALYTILGDPPVEPEPVIEVEAL